MTRTRRSTPKLNADIGLHRAKRQSRQTVLRRELAQHVFLPAEPRRRYRPREALLQDGLQGNIDPFVGRLMAKLKELGIAENTLVVCMADNGPMAHNPPPGCGFAETIFRGGKGDFLEGGVRVPAQAWWPGMIKEGQLVGDIIHEADLFTTFARLAGATDGIPSGPCY